MRLRGFLLVLPFLLVGLSCSRDPRAVSRKYVENGNRYFKTGKYKEASIMYRNAIRKDPKFGEAHYRLGLTELQLAHVNLAERALRRAVELMPDNVDAHTSLADIYLLAATYDTRNRARILSELEDVAKRLKDKSPAQNQRLMGLFYLFKGDAKNAIGQLEKANQAKPDEPSVVMALVQALSSENRFPEAEKLAKHLVEKRKDFLRAYDFLHIAYVRANRLSDAEEILKLRCANNPPDAGGLLQLAQFYRVTRREAEMNGTLQRILSNPTGFPAAHKLVGDFYFANRQYDKAIEEYAAGMKAQPKEIPGYQRVTAEAYIRQGKSQEAMQLLETVVKQNPKDDRAVAMRAALMIRGSKPEQIQAAINDLQGVVRSSPRDYLARYDLGRAYLAKGEVEQARIAFQDAIKLRADYLPPRLALAELHLRSKDYARAVQAADEILGGMSAQSLPARLIRSSALAGMGDFTRAREAITETLKLYPNTAEALIQLALVDFNQGKLKEAEDGFRKLSQSNPADLRGLFGLTETYLKQNKSAQAVEAVQKELERNPGREELMLALGTVAVRVQNYDLAIAQFQNLLTKHPKEAGLYMRLGETYRLTGKKDLAMAALRKAVEAAPGQPAPKFQLSVILDEQGQRAEARTLYEQILKAQPDNAVVLNNLAYMMAESGADLDQALTYAQRAKQVHPESVDVADTLGWIYIKKNLSDNAIDIFRDLTKRQPKRSTFQYHLAMALYQKGDRTQARLALQAALRNQPAKDEEAKIRELMAKIGG